MLQLANKRVIRNSGKSYDPLFSKRNLGNTVPLIAMEDLGSNIVKKPIKILKILPAAFLSLTSHFPFIYVLAQDSENTRFPATNMRREKYVTLKCQ